MKKTFAIATLTISAFFSQTTLAQENPAPTQAAPFFTGADLSYVNEILLVRNDLDGNRIFAIKDNQNKSLVLSLIILKRYLPYKQIILSATHFKTLAFQKHINLMYY